MRLSVGAIYVRWGYAAGGIWERVFDGPVAKTSQALEKDESAGKRSPLVYGDGVKTGLNVESRVRMACLSTFRRHQLPQA